MKNLDLHVRELGYDQQIGGYRVLNLRSITLSNVESDSDGERKKRECWSFFFVFAVTDRQSVQSETKTNRVNCDPS